jgi:hypothetical protein
MHPKDQGYGRERDPSDREPPERDSRDREISRRPRGGSDPLDQRVDRWVTAGRQFVEGVAGSRPGARPAGRGTERRPQLRPRIDELGRWVEGRLDWLLDDGDDWREPWQEGDRGAPVAPVEPPAPDRSRRPMLEAVSRRGRSGAPPSPASPTASAPAPGNGAADDGDWPDDASFTLPRWQRPEGSGEPEPPYTPPATGRPLPRSNRRRG